MKLNKRGFSATFAGVALIFTAACSSQPTGETTSFNSTTPQVVNVYSSRHYDSDEALFKTFTEKTGIQINLIEGKDDELIERIKNEGQNSPADILITVDAGRLWRAEKAGLFQAVNSQTLESAVPENLRDPDDRWFGLTKRARVIVYDKSDVKPSDLSTYEKLADPQWKGRICIRSSGNIYNQSLIGSMIQTDGAEATEKWAKGIVTNLARQPEGGDTDQIKAVAAGQCDVALVNHYYWARLARSDQAEDRAIADKVGIFFPNQQNRGTHVNISGAGVIASAPHKENAIAFLEFLVSPEAQTIFAEGSLEYPVVSSIQPDDMLKGLGTFKVDSVNVASYGENNSQSVQIADRAGWK